MVNNHHIDNLQLSFRIAAAFINIYPILMFLFYNMDPFDTVKKLAFFTNFNQACVALFYAKVLINDLKAVSNNRKQPYTQDVINTHKLLLINSALVTLIFWGAYAIQPSLVLSRNAMKEIPFSFLILFHGGNFIFLLLDELWYFRNT